MRGDILRKRSVACSPAEKLYYHGEALLCTADFSNAFKSYLQSLECIHSHELQILAPRIVNGLETLSEILAGERWIEEDKNSTVQTVQSPLLWCLEKVLKIADKLHHKGRLRLASAAFETGIDLCSSCLHSLDYHHDPTSKIPFPSHSESCEPCETAMRLFLRNAEVFFTQSIVSGMLRNYRDAVASAAAGYQIASVIGSFDLKMKGLLTLASAYRLHGNFKKAISLSSVACDIFTDLINSIEDKKKLSSTKILCFYGLKNLSLSYSGIGRTKLAAQIANSSLDIVSVIDAKELCGLYSFIGGLYMSSNMELFAAASRTFQKLVSICRKMKDTHALTEAYSQLCSLHLRLGHQNLATVFAERNLLTARKFKDVGVESRAYGLLGDCFQKYGKLHRALEVYMKQLATASGNDMLEVCCTAYLRIGKTFYKLGSYNNARFFLHNGLERAKRMPFEESFAKAELLLAKVLEILGCYNDAHAYLRRSVIRFEEQLSDSIYGVVRDRKLERSLERIYRNLIIILVKLDRFEDAFEIAEHVNSRIFCRMMQLKSKDITFNASLDHFDFIPQGSIVLYFSLCGDTLYLWVLAHEKGCVKFCKKCFGHSLSLRKMIHACLSSLALSNKGGNCCFESENRVFYSQRKGRVRQPLSHKGKDEMDKPPAHILLSELFKLLLGPIEHLLRGLPDNSELFIVAGGQLSLVPFHILIGKDYKCLFHHLRVTYLPCLLALKGASQRHHEACPSAIVAGNPSLRNINLNYSSGRKLQSRQSEMRTEMKLVASLLGVRHYEEGAASKDCIMELIKKADVIHLATMGNIDEGCLIFSPNIDRENEEAEAESYLITVDDILAVNLASKLVFVSGSQDCVHGLMDRGSTSYNLVSCFIAAGAVSVVLCQWAMPFECYEITLYKFYRELEKGNSVAKSLQNVMMAMESERAEMHPGHWGGLILFGRDTVVDVSTIKNASIHARLKQNISAKSSSDQDKETEELAGNCKRASFQTLLAHVLQQRNCQEILPLVTELVSLVLSELEKFHQEKKMVKAKCASQFIEAACFRELLLFMGFQFHVDMERPEDCIILFPAWNWDSLLDIAHQCLSAAQDIASKSAECLYSVYRLLRHADERVLRNLNDIIQAALEMEIFMISTKEKRVEMAWRMLESRQFLERSGFYCAGDSLLFHGRKHNIALVKAGKELINALLQLYQKDEEEHLQNHILKPERGSEALKMVSLPSRLLTPANVERKHIILKRMKQINQTYASIKRDGKIRHRETIDLLTSPDRDGVFLGQRQEKPKAIFVSPNGIIKRKVLPGNTPSQDRRPITQDPMVTLGDVNSMRRYACGVYKGRQQRLLEKRKQDVNVLFCGK